MITFDADIASDLAFGNVDVLQKAAAVPPDQQSLPIVVVEEVLRGRLSVIRRAETGKGRTTIDSAYASFQESITFIREFEILPYTTSAEHLFQTWRTQKIRIGTHDLRIAAIAVAHGAALVSRNRRDFDLVPNLHVEYWG